MQSKLSFEKISLLLSDRGEEDAVPSIATMQNVQNKTKSFLSEDEGLFVAYGSLANSYPYKQKSSYQRKFETSELEVAVLENDFLKATFIPSMGGRLWSLIDKKTGENLLYTNDIIRCSNLSTRNAWFSGGVEWNMGIIGHTPYTTEQIFTARLVSDEGFPILRMYEYERIRKATYQMDFWLTDESDFLYCRMRLCNDSDTLAPMYWWSNMAVTEFEGGRIVVPAHEAFTSDKQGVKKVAAPVVNGIDISYYSNIPSSVDYFFDIDPQEVKFIANLNSSGHGLVQASTNRLRGRKLFSWGHTTGSDRWQGYLTENAGKYIEIQAGVERTQYGCIPMPPNSAWEWIEVYGAASIPTIAEDYDRVVQLVKDDLTARVDFAALEKMVVETKASIAKKTATLLKSGSGYAALENALRSKSNLAPMSPHLDFSADKKEQEQWYKLLENGKLDDIDPRIPPQSYMIGDDWFLLLKDSIQKLNKDNWYAHYQLGLLYLNKGDTLSAKESLLHSIRLCENAWGYHALAIIEFGERNYDAAASYVRNVTELCNDNLSVLKECAKILAGCKKHQELINMLDQCPKEIANNGRLQMYRAFALVYLGEIEAASDILYQNGGLVVDDIREGELSLSDLWMQIEQAKYPDKQISHSDVPQQFNFRAGA